MAVPAVPVTIEKDGRITIPKRLRKALNLSQDQTIVLRQVGEAILIEKAGASERRQRAESLVRQAKVEAARDALTLTESESWMQFKAAANALRKAARKRPSSRKRP
ncbi:MAG: AbrB/MazE/SpoVT family DNA-binding domain-containing protein [Chloroflexi bacterium]|nr:AbrB/MazE/SpoVT family DNA-binding domain-containing protein [Chloroflexota bacterium]